MTNTSPITLDQLFRNNRNLPHQLAAIAELEHDIRSNDYDVAMRRDRPWFKTWSQAGKQNDYGPAVKLIKNFEGLRLDAYADSLHGWDVPTIGYGSTHGVKRGDRITQSQADGMLAAEVERVADKLANSVPAWKEMSTNQQGALISFAFNLGPNFYAANGFETISKRLSEKDWKAVPAALELYRNPGTSAEAGLLRRRKAEGALWAEGTVKQQSNPLATPYQSQRDNYRDANRTCFSSSCAMLLMTLKPGAIHSDDDYIKTVFSIGDTIEASVQLKALAKYGIKARFETGGNRALIKRQIDAGKPVPAGFLHHGSVSAPTGGGHYLCIIGYDATGYWVNDPWGEMNLTAGTYGSTVGSKLHYSYANWEPRWMVDGPSTGWCIVA
jgi:GH24 family phage-related lysozyme (muramidase)